MTPIGSIGSSYVPQILPQIGGNAPSTTEAGGSSASTQGFGKMLDSLVSSVNAKQAEADKITQSVLLGNSGQLHQSVIAMQEASVSLSLMVQVRNKLVESYQELMRMQA
jgi:flagellar hook-basal body complex protein FliE